MFRPGIVNDQPMEARRAFRISFEITQHCEQHRQSHHALVPIDDFNVRRSRHLRQHDPAQRIEPLALLLLHRPSEICEKPRHILRPPSIGALETCKPEAIAAIEQPSDAQHIGRHGLVASNEHPRPCGLCRCWRGAGNLFDLVLIESRHGTCNE